MKVESVLRLKFSNFHVIPCSFTCAVSRAALWGWVTFPSISLTDTDSFTCSSQGPRWGGDYWLLADLTTGLQPLFPGISQELSKCRPLHILPFGFYFVMNTYSVDLIFIDIYKPAKVQNAVEEEGDKKGEPQTLGKGRLQIDCETVLGLPGLGKIKIKQETKTCPSSLAGLMNAKV